MSLNTVVEQHTGSRNSKRNRLSVMEQLAEVSGWKSMNYDGLDSLSYLSPFQEMLIEAKDYAKKLVSEAKKYKHSKKYKNN